MWQGRVAPVFDVCRQLLVLDVCDGAVVASTSHGIETDEPLIRASRVVALCGSTLVCGAISEPVAQWIRARGVRVLGFVAGEVDEIVEACVKGELPCARYAMPGCASPRRRRMRRCGEQESHRECGRGRK